MKQTLRLATLVSAAVAAGGASAAMTSGTFEVATAQIVDVYSATFDGPLQDEEGFFGTPPDTRSITVNQLGGTGGGTLDVNYDDATGEILQVNSLLIELADLELVIDNNGDVTFVTVIGGNGNPGPDDIPNVSSPGSASSFAPDPDQSPGTPSIFQNDDSPNQDNPLFSPFLTIVDDCDGNACGLLGFLSLDAIRYELQGDMLGAIVGDQMVLQAQTGNNSIYTIEFSLVPVPVPAAVWLFGSAIAGLAGFSRFRRA